ncbi:MAG: DUF2238 domain-containing protein [Planctomycetota bacterium]|nr:MAG: DUF2238 domain-containing protein [Planctomycetota bacterium]
MQIKKRHLILLAINIISVIIFGTLSLTSRNYEFVIYIGVIIFFIVVITATYCMVPYTDACLFGLTVWAILHMAGGTIYINGTKLYKLTLLPLSEKYHVFCYDQAVHIWGFGVATITMYCLLRPLLKENINRYLALSTVLIMTGLGLGAFNEIVEFIITQIVAETGVGGYLNTSLDLVSNLIGAILGMLYIRLRHL